MIARITLAEVDTVRMSVSRAVSFFEESVLPELHDADGYEGCYVFTTPEGKAAVVTLWRDEEAAEQSLASGLYAEQVEKFVTLLRTPAGRETYDVSVADVSALSTG